MKILRGQTRSGTGDVAPHDRSPSGHAQAVLRSALHQAVRAPSSHNTQPWRFRLVDDRVELYADRTRALPVVDPHDRALVISCGAAAAFLVAALRNDGHSGDVAVLPDPTAPDLLASVGLGPKHVPTHQDRQRFAAIASRHTHRGGFDDQVVPDDVLTALVEDAAGWGVVLHCVTDSEARRRVAELVADGDRAQMADPGFRAELASWVRTNYTRRGDGIPGYAFGIPGPMSLVGPLVMRSVDMGRRQAAKDRQLATTAPALLMLTTRQDTPADWFATGQALGTLLLTATAAGLAASFLNQPIETTALRTPLAELVTSSGEVPQLLLRLGHPAGADRGTPRRVLEDVLEAPR